MLRTRKLQLGETRDDEVAACTVAWSEIDPGLNSSSLVLVFVSVFVDWPLPDRLTP